MRHALPRLLVACALAAAAGIAPAQGTGERGSTPPGVSRDGSRPADGAIQGGSIAPDVSTSPTPQRDVARCRELAGQLREQCLRDLAPGGGGTLPPQGSPPSGAGRGPGEPPPQNPRGPR